MNLDRPAPRGSKFSNDNKTYSRNDTNTFLFLVNICMK